MGFDFGTVVGLVVFGDLKRILTGGYQLGELFAADTLLFVQIDLRRRAVGYILLIVCHFHHP